MMPFARIFKQLLFSLAAAMLVLGMAEGGLRLARFRYLPADSPIVVMEDFGRAQYKDLYRFDPDTLWSLKPGAVYEHRGGERINSLGFRGAEIAAKKPPGVYRVVCLGDSSTFGFGVPLDGTWPAQLQKYLAYRMQDRTVEVINAGVVGYTSTQALAHFERDALPLSPDAVILMLGAVNESFEMNLTDAQRIARARRAAEQDTRLRDAVLELRLSQLLLKAMHAAAQRDRARLTPRTPPSQFEKDLGEFAALARKHGFLLVVTDPHRKKSVERDRPLLLEYSRILKDFSQKNKLPFVDVRSRFQIEADQNILFRDDYHPRPAGHNLIAQMVTYPVFRHEAARAGAPALPSR